MRNRVLSPLLVMLAVLWPAMVHAAPAPAGVDRFARAVVEGWGTADAGGPWTPAGSPDALSVGAGWGAVTLAEAGTGGGALQERIEARDVELAARLRLDRRPIGGSAFAYLVGRWRKDSEIRLKVRVGEDGGVALQATSIVDGAETGVGEEVPLSGVILAAGSVLKIRGQIVGAPAALRMRAWLGGTEEPTTWPVQRVTKGPGLDGAGHVGVRTYLGGRVTNAPIVIAVDDWSARVLDAPTSPSPASPSPAASPPADLAAPGTVLAADELERTRDRGWGTAPVGGVWSHVAQAADFSVDVRQGRMRTVPGATRSAELPEAVGRDVGLLVTVRPERLPAGGNAWFYLVLRRTDTTEVRGRVRIAPDGSVHLGISVVRDGEEQTLGPEIRRDDLVSGPARPIRVRFEGVGSGATRWSIKAWPAGAAEPDGWALRRVDVTPALQGPGSVALRAYVGRAVTSPSVGFLVDDVLALAVAADAQDPVLVGAGDIATCGSRGSRMTAALLDDIPGTVFAAGDLAYPDGTPKQFATCFGPTWGRHKGRMLPALGNREYATKGAAGWFEYFGEALPGPEGWYATDIGSWRIYVLNSQCDQVDCGEGSAQLAWLQADLAENPRQCSLAIWHEPRFTSGPHGDTTRVAPFWNVLYAAGAELVLSGHDHAYERLLPMDPSGALDTDHGLIQVIAGTGGGGGATFDSLRANSAVHDGDTLGVLKLTLRHDSWDWRFLPVPGGRFTDSGSARCHAAPTP